MDTLCSRTQNQPPRLSQKTIISSLHATAPYSHGDFFLVSFAENSGTESPLTRQISLLSPWCVGGERQNERPKAFCIPSISAKDGGGRNGKQKKKTANTNEWILFSKLNCWPCSYIQKWTEYHRGIALRGTKSCTIR